MYPLEQITADATTYAKLTICLNDATEVFSDEAKQRFGEATQLGLSWCLAAQSVLSTAATDDGAMAKVERWFAEATTSATDLNQSIANVLAGFKTMTNTMNGSTFVITDMPQDRANPANDLTEAAWQGIGAGTSLTAAKAAVNADTWAFFATDCGGALTAGEITRAGAGTNGNLNKLAKRLELGNPWPARLLLH